jgi:hypothetical protein
MPGSKPTEKDASNFTVPNRVFLNRRIDYELHRRLIADQAAQAAEIAELKLAVAALTDKLNPPPPPPVKVDSRPDVIPETHEEYLARINREAMARREEEAKELAKRTEGLEDGYWRDSCGLVRDRGGKVALTGEGLKQKLAREAAHDKAARAEDLAWRRAVELPIRHGADKTDGAGDE